MPPPNDDTSAAVQGSSGGRAERIALLQSVRELAATAVPGAQVGPRAEVLLGPPPTCARRQDYLSFTNPLKIGILGAPNA